MEAIYAHNSKPYGGNLLKAKTHWGMNYMEAVVLAYSSRKSKEFFGHTKFTTDTYGKQVFIDELGLEFDEVIVELDDCEKREMWWAAGKIHGYTKSIKDWKPFVFFDNDAGFHKMPPDHFLKSDYRCQHIHIDKNTIFDRHVRRLVRETPNVFPYDIYHEAARHPEGIKGGNAGIGIFNDEELIREFTRYTWAVMESDFMNKVANESLTKNLYQHMSMWNVVVEEILLLQLYRRLRGELPQTIFEFSGLTPTPGTEKVNPSGYFHIWGRKSDVRTLEEFKKGAVEYLPEDLMNRIYKYFNIKQ